jgi:hypothetical protein
VKGRGPARLGTSTEGGRRAGRVAG